MSSITHEKASAVLDAIMDEVKGDSISMFLDWHGIDEDDFCQTVEIMYEAIDALTPRD